MVMQALELKWPDGRLCGIWFARSIARSGSTEDPRELDLDVADPPVELACKPAADRVHHVRPKPEVETSSSNRKLSPDRRGRRLGSTQRRASSKQCDL